MGVLSWGDVMGVPYLILAICCASGPFFIIRLVAFVLLALEQAHCGNGTLR